MTRLLSQARLVVTISVLVALSGVMAWFVMPRQEDPSMPGRWATIVATLPGAEVEDVERWLIEPIEDELAEVEELAQVDGTARAGIAFFSLELGDSIYDTDEAWDVIERALDRARAELPSETIGPHLNRRWSDQQAVVLAMKGAPLKQLHEHAETLRRALLRVPGVAHVGVLGDPDERVVVRIPEKTLALHGLTLTQVTSQLVAQNAVLPGATVNTAGRVTLVRSPGEVHSLEELAAVPIRLPAGATVALGNLAEIELAPRTPVQESFALDGVPTVALAVSPQDNIDLVRFGEQVREAEARLAPRLLPAQVHEVSFQPDFVSERLNGLGQSLLLGIAIVALVLFLTMGARLGAIVASVVPLVALASMGLYAMGGGVLHQMSISALVISLGLLVDNAIVIAENMQQRMDEGLERWSAAQKAVKELALPLGAATGTTLAAFVPMLLAPGKTGDFTRAIPIVIMITLSVSYVAAVSLTPILGALFLKKRAKKRKPMPAMLANMTTAAAARPLATLGWVGLAMFAAVALAPLLRSQFFPASDRQMVIVELAMPEGAHIEATSQAANALQTQLLGEPEVRSVFTAVGTGLPRLYYNLVGAPARPNVAELAVQVRRVSDVGALLDKLDDTPQGDLGHARITARRLEQGPPVLAPIEVRVYGEDLEELFKTSEGLVARLRRIEGIRSPTHDIGTGVPVVHVQTSPLQSHRIGIARTAVSQALYGQFAGLPAGKLWRGENPIDIVVRADEGEHTPIDQLAGLGVGATAEGVVPAAAMADIGVRWSPAAIRHRNRARVATITAYLEEGLTTGDVAEALGAVVADTPRAPGVTVELGGTAAEAGAANRALLETLPIGLALLLFFLMLEFNSFRRTAIVLTTVPLAMVGIVPGLVISGQPFGFMSLLGTFALAGIVVNSAIVLLDVIDRARREGLSQQEAVHLAVEERWRPILLTTCTTVAGLLPLALTPSPLWPPLAFAMISGILASTLLTLVAVPALYRMMFETVPSTLRGLRRKAQTA